MLKPHHKESKIFPVYLLNCNHSQSTHNLIDACLTVLSNEEIKQSQHYKTLELQHHNILSKGLRRYFLAFISGLDRPQNLQFIYTAYRKPLLNSHSYPLPPSFSVSHSQMFLCISVAYSTHPIGIDCEYPPKIQHNHSLIDVLHTNERVGLSSAKDFYYYWTRKEAYLKAIGTGLHASLTDVDTSQIQVYYQGVETPYFLHMLTEINHIPICLAAPYPNVKVHQFSIF